MTHCNKESTDAPRGGVKVEGEEMTKRPIKSSQGGSPTGPNLPPWGCEAVPLVRNCWLKWEWPRSQRAARSPLFSSWKSGKLPVIQKSQRRANPLKTCKLKCRELVQMDTRVTWAQQMKAMDRVSKKTDDTTTSTERCGPRLCGARRAGAWVRVRGAARPAHHRCSDFHPAPPVVSFCLSTLPWNSYTKLLT